MREAFGSLESLASSIAASSTPSAVARWRSSLRLISCRAAVSVAALAAAAPREASEGSVGGGRGGNF